MINNIEDIVVILDLTLFLLRFLPCFPAVDMIRFFCKESTIKKMSFKNYNRWYLTHSWSEKLLVVPPSLHECSFEIRFTVLLTLNYFSKNQIILFLKLKWKHSQQIWLCRKKKDKCNVYRNYVQSLLNGSVREKWKGV